VSSGPVVVVGGGIAGLSAAWEAVQREPGRQVVVLEAGDRLGGKILTTDVAGRPVDAGPDAFLARVPWALDLCRELGLDGELVSPSAGTAWVATPRGPRRVPEGLVLGVPARVGPMVRSGVLSPRGLLRAGLEPLLPRRPAPTGTGDSVGRTVRRRFGREVHELLVDPLVGSINAGDTDELSLTASVPQLADAAGRSRSLLLGLRAQQRAATGAAGNGRPAPVFLTHPRGLGHVVEVLVGRLRDAGVDLRPSCGAAALRPTPGGGWVVDTPGGPQPADAVVLAVPAPAAAGLLVPVSFEAAAALRAIPYASVAIVTLALPEGALRRPLEGSGLLVPKHRGPSRAVTAVSFGSTKWAHWARPGEVLLRVSVGRTGEEAVVELDDPDLLAAVRHDLEELLGLDGEAQAVRISRWPSSFPQYLPGHLARVAAVERALAADAPGVAVAGAAYRGLGIPACIRQGREAAAALLGRAAER